MNVSVDVHDTEGNRVPNMSENRQVYQTDVFNSQIDGVEKIIYEILNQNESFELGAQWETKSSLA